MDIIGLMVLIFIILSVVIMAVGIMEGIPWLSVIGAFLTLFWWFAADSELRVTDARFYTTEKVLVSASPSDIKYSGSFIWFSGTLEGKRFYLLREELEPGLYKDFEVKKEVYIRELDYLTDKGKFIQRFECSTLVSSLVVFGKVVFSTEPPEVCKYARQEIQVPVGSVIKEINI